MASLRASSQACAAVIGLALLLGSGGLALWQIGSRERGTFGAVPALQRRDGLEISPLTGTLPNLAEEIAATYHGVFQGTVYYTVLESAFTEGSGFDLTPTTKPGLLDRTFAKDFLKAVEVEGFGRMKTVVEGKPYVSCCRGQWSYAREPLDSCGRPLKALRSSAVGADYELVRLQASFRVWAAELPQAFLEARWEVCDTGSGLKPGQIDFYWGEDAPLGPGRMLSRPRGMPSAAFNPTVLVLR
jgi:hypothetical protein